LKISKKISTFLSIIQITAFSLPLTAFGETYKDIPKTHWAYTAIENISAKGYLNDFQSENFNPDGYIDKFTISKILASVAGFSYDSSDDYTEEKNIISKYSSKYSKWYKEANNQIAFLLSKNILLEEDLENFMLFSDDGSEKFRAISREEIAVFFVRLIGKTSEAEALKDSNLFTDSEAITNSRRGSINYLKTTNVLNGDSANYCNPKSAVTKAEFCVLLNNLIILISNSKTSENTEDNSDENKQDIVSTKDLLSTEGVVNKYYKTLGIIQIKVDNDIKPYRLSKNVKVRLNGEETKTDSIKSGLNISAIINKSEIIEISLSDSNVNNDTNNSDTSKETVETTESTTDAETTTSESSSEEVSTELCMDSSAKGTIQSIKLGQSLQNECIIEISAEDGETKYFSATRYTVPIYSLKTGDLIEITAKKGKIKTLKFVEKNNSQAISGYITDIDDETVFIRTADSEEYEYYYDENQTECFDCTTGKSIDFDDVKKYTEAYIVCEDTNSRTIDVIFILDNL